MTAMARRRAAMAALLFLVAAGLRVPLLRGGSLWADEVFSLAIATGHSLEHPAAQADPALGDFIESRGPLPAQAWGRYLGAAPGSDGPSRIIRAVLLSDTSPPLYYVLLGMWIGALGPSDFALRLFSVCWAVLTVPLLWLLARRLGGTRAAVASVLLYAFAPTGLYYSGEGRMYSLLWCLATSFVWLTVRLHDRGAGPVRLALWTGCAAAGFLTHYFFAFVWVAGLLWLLVHPGRLGRRWASVGASVTVLLILPWYLRVPEILSRWRVTGDWLAGSISLRDAITNPLKLAWSLLSGRGLWGGWLPANRVAQGAFALLLLAACLRYGRAMFRPATRVAWAWLAAAALGPVVFDLLRGSAASGITRYALDGLPAAMLLAGVALSRLPRTLGAGLTLLILLAWSPGVWDVLAHGSEYRTVSRRTAAAAARWAGPSDLVLVHSIPSGMLGVARYLPPAVPVAAWVGQLEQRRVPEDIEALAAGRRRIVFVRIHDVGAPTTELDWLREHGRMVGEAAMEGSTVIAFELPGESGYAPPRTSSRQSPTNRLSANASREGVPTASADSLRNSDLE